MPGTGSSSFNLVEQALVGGHHSQNTDRVAGRHLAQYVVDLAPGGVCGRAPVTETDRTGGGDNDGGCRNRSRQQVTAGGHT
jgi:hypothetical protein